MMTSQQGQQKPSTLPERLRDKWWRLTHLYKIKDKNGQLVTFYPNIVQLKHIRDRGSHRYCRICKARQHGFTTYYCIDYLDEALWVAGTVSAIIAHEQRALVKIFEIVKRAYDNLPPDIMPITNADNANELKFEYRYDGVKLDSGIYVSLKVRSGTVHNLHITEKAYIKDQQELKAGSKQAVPKTGRITEETTANGMNDFFDDFTESINNENPGPMDYRGFFYAWFENPDYTLDFGSIDPETLTQAEKDLQAQFHLTDGQLLWRRWKMKELSSKQEGIGLTGEQLFKQEYPSTWMEAFQSGAGAVFPLEKLEKEVPSMPMTDAWIRRECEEKNRNADFLKTALDLRQMGVSIWELPVPAYEYVVGVDPSDGQGADFGVIDVWTRPDADGQLRQVAQYYGKLLPDDLARLTMLIATFYNRAFVGVENNMLTTILFLKDIYDNYYFTIKIDERKEKKTKKLGWNTNVQTREKMIDDFQIHYDDDLLKIRSRLTLTEMRTFIRKPTASGAYKREHADGRFDDALFAAMIAIQMSLVRQHTARVFAQKPAGF